ncbi:putative casein kinase II, alpha chain [Trypanosoma rangeli]|uniref:Putative casein kinase II, alpha chain n=1 Tax=Trypanosoma rangeli TaxID=5698 RepID=A0A3R7K7D0_TRYRA|nr:putative casein kinase II, alpha chain [Trypanosoma rangeli]RNF01170.1 putative casein kinase II, alpha chain [Trypanosoma rangeli]|eukprot:RNF01170.1 putative casein kinase II, alpha chain [Trypanosoma rangeli]
MQEVENTFRTLHEALGKAVNFFATGAMSNGVPLTQQQAVDVLDVYDTLLDAEETGSQDARLHILRRSLQCGFMRFLADIVAQPLQHLHEFDAQVPQPFLPFRMKAVRSLQRLLLSCSDLGEVSASCFRVAVDEELIPQLLQVVSESPHEPLRLGAAETLFIFILRIQHGPTGFVASSGINTMRCALMRDGSHMVRSMCASILREVLNTHALEFTNPVTVSALIKILGDTSADVRTLAAEILEQTLRLYKSDMAYMLHDARSLLLPLRCILDQDPSVEVVESAARLLGTCCGVAVRMHLHAFFAAVVSLNLSKVVLLRIRDGGNAAAARARSLRLLIQYTPAVYELPRQILHDTEVLAVLLKGIVDAGRGRTTPGEDFTAFQIKGLEMALCLAIVLTQSPTYRERLTAELKDYPQWAAAIKNAVISLLNAASLEYFTSIELWDVTGHHLNLLDRVPWDANHTPQQRYIRQLFQEQAQRISVTRETVSMEYEALSFPQSDAYHDFDEVQQEKKARLTFILLAVATNITFPVESRVAATAAVEQPLPVQRRSESRAATGVPTWTQAGGSKQRECVVSPEVLVSPARLGNGPPSTTLLDEKEAVAIAYDKFNSSMSFVMRFTQHYSKAKRKAGVVVETDDGYRLRMSRLKNPWHTIVEDQRLKTWQVKNLKVGDLFYFSVPFDEINAKALGAVLYKARRHMVYLKKELLVTPQCSKGRRWFLYDMMRNIMPKALGQLEELNAFVQSRGADGVRFPIFLFREKELHFGERTLHPGNLMEVLDQIGFYFAQSADKTVGVDNARLQQLAGRLDNVEESASGPDTPNFICSLNLCEGVTAGTNAAHEEAEDGGGYGHGTISSDSEANV